MVGNAADIWTGRPTTNLERQRYSNLFLSGLEPGSSYIQVKHVIIWLRHSGNKRCIAVREHMILCAQKLKMRWGHMSHAAAVRESEGRVQNLAIDL
jgi:hypothetical protein